MQTLKAPHQRSHLNDTKSGQNLPTEERNQIIEQYLPLVQKIARNVICNNTHRLEYDDLVNVGVFGLMHAIKNYDLNYDVHFAAYCKIRIRGAMLDELRRQDWVPRHTRQQIKEIQNAEQEYSLQFNRLPEPAEMADKLGISEDTFNSRNSRTSPVKMFPLDQLISNEGGGSGFTDLLADSHTEVPEQQMQKENCLDRFTKGLTKTEQLILILYYQENLNMFQTGVLLGISESRVCQIHSQIIHRLRAKDKQSKNLKIA